MAAGLAPPTHPVRWIVAIVAAFALAFVLPASPALANVDSGVAADDEDGGKKKDKSSKKSDDDDDDDDDDSDSDDDDADDDDSDSDDEDADDDDSDSDDDDAEDDDSDSNDDDAADDDAIARSSDAPSSATADEVQSVERSAKPESAAPAMPATTAAATGSLLATGAYLPMADAIALARKAGAQGDVLQVDLEYDAFRGFATCDVTFSSGTEYEMNAETGELLGQKEKDPRKLALLTPLATDAKSLKAFTDIIGQVTTATGQAVLEMELKHLKGQAGVIFEVVTADGVTSHFDAATGKPAAGV